MTSKHFRHAQGYVAAGTLFLLLAGGLAAHADSSTDLVGLWEAKRRFGPDLRGPLTLARREGQWVVEIGGLRASARLERGLVTAELPASQGILTVELPEDGGAATGHWTQPRSKVHGLRWASPITLQPVGPDRWAGLVVPFDDQFTLQLPIVRRGDGSLGTFLRNPERNQGVFWRLDRVEADDSGVDFISRRGDRESVLARATRREDGRLSLYVSGRGGTYDLERLDPGRATSFLPRGVHPAGRYQVDPPPAGDDGWPVGSLVDVAMTPGPIQRLVEEHFSSPPSSVHDVYPHGLLIARHGKLVFEEYFHGFHRDRPHDTRSASKSLTAVLAGAAIEAGLPLAASTPVYATLRPGDPAPEADPRRAAMQLEHLLTMSSGLACDDSDPTSPGQEDTMQEQSEQPDWYAYTLDLPMAHEPGERPLYCSATANLAGAVIAHAAGEPLPRLFHRLIAEPLQMGRYHLAIAPTGHAYMGGGIRWLPRDFLKLGQLMLDGGTWRGRRIVSPAWAERAVSPLVELREREYGYLWWTVEYPYKDRTVRAFFAGGNGGQLVIGVPELDLVVAFFAGNYSDRTTFRYQQEFFPQYILQAVE